MTHVLVVGAGPAGLAAATSALRAGATVTLLDASDEAGGQYWRHLPAERAGTRESTLHHGWSRFTTLRATVENSPGCEVVLGAQVWSLEPSAASPCGFTVNVSVGPADSQGTTALRLSPDAIVLATGAHDRTLPFPGWDLPGVFTGGAAQALAKGERVRVGQRVVVAGAGPFLLPVAASVAESGARVLGVFEASRARNLLTGWGPRPWRLLGARSKAGELAGYIGAFLRHRVRYSLGTGVIAVHGTDRVESVTIADLAADWSPIPGSERVIAGDAVCVSHGFTPRLELALAAGCDLDAERFVTVDSDQRTSVPHVFAAGEITSIGGVDLSLAEGTLAGHAAAGGSPDSPEITSARKARHTFADFARRIEAAHGIRPGWHRWMHDDTIVCRCEEVGYGSICRVAAGTASVGLRSLKLSTRAGLGICQGRMCGRTVEQLLAAAAPGGALIDSASTDRRPIVTPQRLSDLAHLSAAEDNT